jgi:hypothetical protein
MPKGACQKGVVPKLYMKSGFLLHSFDFLLFLFLLMEDLAHFWEILGIFGAQILGGSWEWITNFRSI